MHVFTHILEENTRTLDTLETGELYLMQIVSQHGC